MGHGRLNRCLPLGVIAELGLPLRSIASLHGGDLLVGDSRGWLHRVSRETVVATHRAHAAAITSIAVARHGTWVTGSEDGTVRCWRDRQLLSSSTARDFVTSVAIDARGTIVCAGYDGTIWWAR